MMTDASKIQQMNNLARELMKHGQASTMEEAMQKAQAQLSENPGDSNREPAPPVSMETPSTEASAEENTTQELPAEDTENGQPETEQTTVSSQQADSSDEQSQNSEEVGDLDMQKLDELNNLVSQQQTTISNLTNTVQSNTQNIAQFDSKVNQLIADLAQVKDKLTKLLDSPVTPPLKKDEAAAGQTQIKPDPSAQPNASSQPKQDASGHARSGNYKPDDVSIEKMFYCGPK